MEVEHRQAELFAALHFVEEGCAAHEEFLGVFGAEVNEVAVVGEDAVGGVAAVGAVALEGFDVGGEQGL